MTHTLKMAPYGQASFTSLRGADFAYVDKTKFIPVLEQCGTFYPFMVRPRRFGKSVFANMLMAYYDKAAAGDFKKNFSGTWIGEHPTALANQYFALKFDFSGIVRNEDLVETFIEKVKAGMQHFANRYLCDDEQLQSILDSDYKSPVLLLLKFLRHVSKKINGELYLVIDEYDQFSQEILSSDPDRFRNITGADGFLKGFYANIKDATQNLIKWVYITGVTSISLDSMTSGFNIALNVSTLPEFAPMLGFTDDELRGLIPQIVDVERYGHSVEEIFNRMKVLYDGYRFSPDSDVTVFNSSMCLYYLREIAARNTEPAVLLDPAFSIDLTKIDGILSLSRDKGFVEKIVTNVLFDRPIPTMGLSSCINMNASMGVSNREVLTALVFMGFLTFSADNAKYLVCPNRAVKELFFKYWFWRVEHLQQEVNFFQDDQKQAVASLAGGDVRPLLQFVAEALSQSVGVHALTHLNETAIQMAVHMAVNTNSVYKVTAAEEALGVGHADLVLRPNPQHPDAAGWLIEFKYLRKSEAKQPAIDSKLSEAEAQLNRYASAENMANIPNLKKAAVVFAGTELKGLKVC